MTDGTGSLITIVGIIGGTGKEGSALAKRWAHHGYKVLIGSRNAEKAVQVAAELNEELGGEYVSGMGNEEAVRQSTIVVLSVPYSAHRPTLEGLKPQLENKILVDITVPLVPPKVAHVHLPEGKAASLEAQAIVGESVKVVAAFQCISYIKLRDLTAPIASDVLVCGDDVDAKAEVIKLVEAASMRGYDAGPLVNAIAAESLVPVLISINKKYGVKHAGIRITGIE
ncbi:MAG: NADPH-dependent F420 reductase [Aggregatilineales bacterium]